MSTRPISSCQLKNGLSLLCLDQSKKIAPDCWHICVTVKINIPVVKKWFTNNPLDEERFQQIRGALGQEVLFEQKKERPFIRAAEKKQLVIDMCASAVEMGMKYCSKEAFAARYILKVFAEQQGRR